MRRSGDRRILDRATAPARVDQTASERLVKLISRTSIAGIMTVSPYSAPAIRSAARSILRSLSKYDGDSWKRLSRIARVILPSSIRKKPSRVNPEHKNGVWIDFAQMQDSGDQAAPLSAHDHLIHRRSSTRDPRRHRPAKRRDRGRAPLEDGRSAHRRRYRRAGCSSRGGQQFDPVTRELSPSRRRGSLRSIVRWRRSCW